MRICATLLHNFGQQLVPSFNISLQRSGYNLNNNMKSQNGERKLAQASQISVKFLNRQNNNFNTLVLVQAPLT